MKNVFLYLLVAVVLLGGAFLYLQNKHGEEVYTGPVQSIRLGVETSLLPAPVWIAEHEGYFERYGLDVTIEEYDSGRASLVGMLAGEVDISAAAPTPIMFNSFSRDDFVYFGTFASSNKDIKLTVRHDSGIVTAQDLVGKRIGTALGTTGQFVVDQLLFLESVDASSVEVLNYPPSALPEALAAGEIDGMVIWEPHGHAATRLVEVGVRTVDISDIYTTTFNFLAMDVLLEQQPEVLARFLQAIEKAEDFIEAQDQDAQTIVANRLGVPLEDVSLFWNDFVFDLTMDQHWLVNIEHEARWAIQNALVEAEVIPNYLEWIYTDAMRAVSSATVTIVE